MTDVVVIGGGPAGATAATILREHGLSVVLLEKEKFPRFQIGESLLPFNNPLFQRLGIWDAIESSCSSGAYFRKKGAYFVTADGAVELTFRFDQTYSGDLSRSFQVKRAAFDDLLLRHAASRGADVREEFHVSDVDLSRPDAARVTAVDRSGGKHEFTSRFVIDASGHGAILAGRNGWRADAPRLRKIALFAHYRGVAPSAPDDNAGNTVIAVLKNSWFWMIPLNSELTSVGLVVDRDEFLGSGLSAEEVLDRTIAVSPYVAERMRSAERETGVYARKDFSFRVDHVAGPNHAVVGDAAGFIDPIFSTGVFMAMKSAEVAADAVAVRLRTGSSADLMRYQRLQRKAYERYFRFIEYFYRKEFLEIFLRPSHRFGLFRVIVSLLAGDAFERRADRWKLELFFLLVKIQKWRAIIAPPIAWERLPEMARAPIPEERSLV